jgi:DNA gyrase subunit B
VREYAAIESLIERLGRRYDTHVLQTLWRHAPVPADATLETWARAFAAALNARESDGQFEVQARLVNDAPALRVTRRFHGSTQLFNFDADFFAGTDYRRIAALRTATHGLLGEGASVSRGERNQTVASFDDAVAWLLAEARRGMHIQRYKGLGEMNPEQLWETTLDPAHRRLVRVNIEDAVASDQVFTTLMGDEVDPRREFIEKNALLVSNLDL